MLRTRVWGTFYPDSVYRNNAEILMLIIQTPVLVKLLITSQYIF